MYHFLLVCLDSQERICSDQYLLLDILNGISERLKGMKYIQELYKVLMEHKHMIQILQIKILLLNVRLARVNIDKKMSESIYDLD